MSDAVPVKKPARFLAIKQSMAYLRNRGYIVGKVEQWIPVLKRKRDLFGFVDVVAIGGGATCVDGHTVHSVNIWAVQTTTTPHQAEHIRYIKEQCTKNARAWLLAGGRIVVHGWALKGMRGSRKLWSVTETEIRLEELSDGEAKAHD